MADFSIQREKIAQAVEILKEKNVDAWLTFVRETSHNADPALGLIVGQDVTWHSAFIITKTGRRVAIVGRYDADNLRLMGGYDTVIGYDKSIQPDLLKVLGELGVKQIAVNYSESDSAADGLSHGMYLTLQRYFEGTPYEMISAEKILNSIRGRKSAGEIARIRAAVKLTEEVIEQIGDFLKPGLSEVQIYDYVHGLFKANGVVPSWEPKYCPIVNCGPDSAMGHAGANEKLFATAGQVVHVDLGVKLNDYISDMQRMWYIQPRGETSIPEPVQKAFDAVRKAILAAAAVLKPGVQGYVVDDAARNSIVASGYPEYQHAVGHHIGRTVHDGATLLGPRWERYGKASEGIVEAGNIFTLELGVHVPGYGIVSLEEDVLVTNDGLDWVGAPQTELMVVKV
ncbi:MAG: aminopeptidase P family protein [Anaerolineae bacterium]|nr:aminopeptidase P family protein [Anaerolineae bacterium]